MSTIVLNVNAASLFIEKNYLAVFGTDYEQIRNNDLPVQSSKTVAMESNDEPVAAFMRSSGPYYPEFTTIPYTWIYVYDISNKASPKLIKNITMAGYYLKLLEWKEVRRDWFCLHSFKTRLSIGGFQ